MINIKWNLDTFWVKFLEFWAKLKYGFLRKLKQEFQIIFSGNFEEYFGENLNLKSASFCENMSDICGNSEYVNLVKI